MNPTKNSIRSVRGKRNRYQNAPPTIKKRLVAASMLRLRQEVSVVLIPAKRKLRKKYPYIRPLTRPLKAADSTVKKNITIDNERRPGNFLLPDLRISCRG